MIPFQILDDYYFNDPFLKARIFFIKLIGGINKTIMITFTLDLTYPECLQQLPSKIAETIDDKLTN